MSRFPHLTFELARLARAPRLQAVRFLFVAVLVGFAALLWPWNARGIQDLLRGSSDIFRTFFCAEMLLAIVVVPALVAPAIPAEREAHTLELLVSCPEPEGRLVAGKLASHTVLVLAVLAAGFPFAFASTLLGGVPLERAVASCVHVGMTAAFATCVGVRCSLAWPGTVSATVAAVVIHAGTILACTLLYAFTVLVVAGGLGPGLVIFLSICAGLMAWRWHYSGEIPKGCAGSLLLLLMFFGIFALDALLLHRHGSRGIAAAPALYAICPWWAYAQDSLSADRPTWTKIGLAWTFHAAACILVLRGAIRHSDSGRLLLGSRASRLDRVSARGTFRSEWRERQRREIESKRALGVSTPVPMYTRLHLHPRADIMNPSKINPFLPVGRDPVYWKETSWARFPALNRLRLILAITSWMVTLSAGMAIATGRGEESQFGIYIQLVLTVVLVAAVGATTLAPERENGTISLLVSTGYPATRIVLGKALAALRWSRAVFIPVGIQLLLGIGILGAWGSAIAMILLGTVASVLGVSIGVSGTTRHPRLAFGICAIVIMALWTIPGLAADRWLDAAPFRILNPFVALDDILTHARHFTPFPDPRQFANFAALSLAAAFVPPALAALFLERQVRA